MTNVSVRQEGTVAPWVLMIEEDSSVGSRRKSPFSLLQEGVLTTLLIPSRSELARPRRPAGCVMLSLEVCRAICVFVLVQVSCSRFGDEFFSSHSHESHGPCYAAHDSGVRLFLDRTDREHRRTA